VLLWPESPQRKARQNLRRALYNLRQAIEIEGSDTPFLLVSRHDIQFSTDSDHWLDVTAFTDLLDTCQTHPHRRLDACADCVARLQAAVDLYRGDFLAGLSVPDSEAFEGWRFLKQEQIHRQAMNALTHLATYHERRRDYEQAGHYLRRQLELEPWREEAHYHLMRTLILSGQRSAAIQQYETCRHILAEELGVEPAAETTALYEQNRTGEIAPHLPVPVSPPHNLPALLTPTFGREAQSRRLAQLVTDPACRLVTIVGEGGIGKTRLALEVATSVCDRFSDGAWFVPLDGLAGDADGDVEDSARRQNEIVSAIAKATGFSFDARQPLQAQLVAYLRTKKLLLVLDNFDHLLAGADVVLRLLQQSPNVAILCTSREPLRFQAEYTFPLAGLSVPDPAGGFEALRANAGVRLFVERADRTPRGFQLTAENAGDVARLCRLVAGIPLALELAAAQVAEHGLSEIIQGIQTALGFPHHPRTGLSRPANDPCGPSLAPPGSS